MAAVASVGPPWGVAHDARGVDEADVAIVVANDEELAVGGLVDCVDVCPVPALHEDAHDGEAEDSAPRVPHGVPVLLDVPTATHVPGQDLVGGRVGLEEARICRPVEVVDDGRVPRELPEGAVGLGRVLCVVDSDQGVVETGGELAAVGGVADDPDLPLGSAHPHQVVQGLTVVDPEVAVHAAHSHVPPIWGPRDRRPGLADLTGAKPAALLDVPDAQKSILAHRRQQVRVQRVGRHGVHSLGAVEPEDLLSDVDPAAGHAQVNPPPRAVVSAEEGPVAAGALHGQNIGDPGLLGFLLGSPPNSRRPGTRHRRRDSDSSGVASRNGSFGVVPPPWLGAPIRPPGALATSRGGEPGECAGSRVTEVYGEEQLKFAVRHGPTPRRGIGGAGPEMLVVARGGQGQDAGAGGVELLPPQALSEPPAVDPAIGPSREGNIVPSEVADSGLHAGRRRHGPAVLALDQRELLRLIGLEDPELHHTGEPGHDPD
mmetsp:Transcript_23237/g.67800  ORF Transcript_23237/g.67800 Transcript_23237/m.67800 type:complete len:486 (-) Transcript_23237:1658-3115(-)